MQTSTPGHLPRRWIRLTIATGSAVLLFLLLAALGTWQLQRMAWKHGLIERVQARANAELVSAPGASAWPAVTRDSHEYLRVRLQGHFLNDSETLVQANTTLGAGFWLLTPLQQDDGSVVIVNRGFLPPQARDPAQRGQASPSGEVEVHGLLRISEPLGAFLRHNDAAAGRWFSRDVPAIAQARGLPGDRVAPYFVDEAAAPGQASDAWPRGGLTVLRFTDHHLIYALTWYALALMVLAGGVQVWRQEGRRRHGRDNGGP